MLPEEKLLLQNYRDYAAVPLVNTDPEKWPIRSGRIGSFVLDAFSKQFNDCVDELKRQGMSLIEIGQLFRTPSRLWRMSHHYLNGLRQNHYPLSEQRHRMLEFLTMIRGLKHASEFIENGKNLILSPREVENILTLDYFTPENKSESALVHRLCGALWAYIETLYFVAHELSMEIHGQYDIPSQPNSALIIRDYFDLFPLELWPETGSVTCRSLRVLAIYDGVKIEFDVYNNPYTLAGDLVAGLRKYRIEMDGQNISLAECETFCDKLCSIISLIAGEVEQWPLKQVAKKYADVFWYRIKPLNDRLGRDWRPPAFVYERFDQKDLPPEATAPTPKEKILKMLDLTEET